MKKLLGIAALSAALAAAALVAATGSASAVGRCGENGTLGDATLDLPGVVYVGLNQESVGTRFHGYHLCAHPPGVGVGHGLRDPDPSNLVGVGIEGTGFTGLTGVEVAPPSPTIDAPGGGTTGGNVRTGNTCTWVNGVRSCPGGSTTIVGVSLNDGELTPAVGPPPTTPGCIGVDNTCAPIPSYVKVLPDASRPVVIVETPVTTQGIDPGPRCINLGGLCP